MNPLTDDSIMPYGQHKGKPLIDVPADYLLFIYQNHKLRNDLKEYIEDNMEVIKAQIAYEKKRGKDNSIYD